jgi:hypothetical protein
VEKNNYKQWIEFLEDGLYSESTPFLQFAVLWLSFASFLNERYYDEIKERHKLNRFIKDFRFFYKRLLKEEKGLFKQKLLDFSKTKDGGRKFVLNLQRGKRYMDEVPFETENDIEDFEKFVNVIYQIRCNFFHGDKIPFDKDDESLVKWAYGTFLYFWERFINTEL